MPQKRTPLVDRMKRDLIAILERNGASTIREDQPTKMQAARELIAEGLALEKLFGPLPARGGRHATGSKSVTVLEILKNPAAIGSTAWEIAAGRVSRTHAEAVGTPSSSMARLLDIEIGGQAFEALVDAVTARVIPAVLEALRGPKTADLTADEAVLTTIGDRTGFTMDQALAWMGWPLDRPAIRVQVGAQLRRLGFVKARRKNQLGELVQVYARSTDPNANTADDFAERLAVAMREFTSLTQAEVAAVMGLTLDLSTQTRIGRAMPRIGFRKRVRYAGTPDRTIVYERMRG